MDKIAIIHFAPIERYPPVQNLLNELERSATQKLIVVFTTCETGNVGPFKLRSKKIRIVRLGKSGYKTPTPVRFWNYFVFYFSCLLLLIRNKPVRILYFETLSSFPAYIYKRFFNSACAIFIHYHEYLSQEEQRTGMKLVRYFHTQEKWLYPRASWISQTNSYRMALFKKDINNVTIENEYILPNYPPAKWWTSEIKTALNSPLRVVYVGALSLSSMYVVEFANWVIARNGKVLWDIYSYNCDEKIKAYLKNLNSNWILLKDGVSYDHLPVIFKNYDVGVILYTGHIPNYVFNAPNKLFEYMACGLDVWFPDRIKGSLPYCTYGFYPKVVSIDFNQLIAFDLENAVDRNGCHYHRNILCCENALHDIIHKLLKE